MTPRLLTLDDVDAYVVYLEASDAESGRDGDIHHGPYSREEPFDAAERRQRTVERWSKPIGTPGWRRAWGCHDGARIVGNANVGTSSLVAERHRVNLGMGVLRPYRRQGLGRALLEAVIGWCRAEASIAWLDLGVFHENAPAIAMYESMGFERTGITVDRFRVDGIVIDDISMTLRVE